MKINKRLDRVWLNSLTVLTQLAVLAGSGYLVIRGIMSVQEAMLTASTAIGLIGIRQAMEAPK